MINTVVLEGYLFNDLSKNAISKSSNGKEMLSFAFILANTKDDDRTFVNCLAFDKNAKFLANYGVKGSRIFVKGSIIAKKDKTGKQVSLSVLLDTVSLIQKEKTNGVEEKNDDDNEFNEEDFPF